jgi:hypothetical protein
VRQVPSTAQLVVKGKYGRVEEEQDSLQKAVLGHLKIETTVIAAVKLREGVRSNSRRRWQLPQG